MAKAMSDNKSGKRRDWVLSIIAIFKFVKTAVLVGGALSAWKLINPQTAGRVIRWILQLPTGVQHRIGERLVALFVKTTPGDLRVLGVVLLAYGCLFATEGTGLWLQKRWAEYLTIIATASFLPFEGYEIIKRVAIGRLAILLANLAVLVYLIWKVRQKEPSRAR